MSEDTNSVDSIEPAGDDDSIRDTLEQAFEKHDEIAKGAPDDPAKAATDAGKPDTGANRDAVGRFAPKRAQAPGANAATGAEGEAAPAKAAETQSAAAPTDGAGEKAAGTGENTRLNQAPVSWNPQEREHWAAMPAAAREAVMRREHEIQRALHESSESRRGMDAMKGVISPFLQNINAANGGDVIGSVRTLFEYDNRLRHGTQIEKARALTTLIKSYGVDIAALDSELAGAPHNPQTQQQDAVQAAINRELGPMREHLQRMQQAEFERQQYAQQTVAQEVSQGISAFAADPEHKHFDAVRMDMADILDLAKAQNKVVTLKDAYDSACWHNPQIRATLLQEQAAQRGAGNTQQAQRARRAAVGVTGAPRVGGLPPVDGKPGRDDRGADIRAAWDAATGNEMT